MGEVGFDGDEVKSEGAEELFLVGGHSLLLRLSLQVLLKEMLCNLLSKFGHSIIGEVF